MAALSAIEAADYLIQKAISDDSGDLLTNLKLQKLLYYAQGCHLAIYGEPLFDETVEAWDLGPVYPIVYHAFKVCGRQPIEETSSDAVNVDSNVSEFLDVIVGKFGGYSASRLVSMTHNEQPWVDNYVSGYNNEISMAEISEFFKIHWMDDKIAIEEDGYDENLVAALLRARDESASLQSVSAEEMVEWLETA